VGAYDSRLGLGYGELAARSRSQHKSQGFGRGGERGPLPEYFLPLAGTAPTKDLLEGLPFNWSRFGALAAPLDAAFEKARAALDRDAPEKAIPDLLAAHTALAALPARPRIVEARRRLDEVLAACAGLFVRATAPQPAAAPGEKVRVSVEIVLRRPVRMTVAQIAVGDAPKERIDAVLDTDSRREIGRDVVIPADAPISAPYWLASPPAPGHYVVADPKLIGEPLGPPALTATVELALEDRTIHLVVPVVYVWTDRVHGERIRPFLIGPPATLTPLRQATLFPNGATAPVTFRVRAWTNQTNGEVTLPLPDGWGSEPRSAKVTLARAGDEKTVSFQVTPPKDAVAIDVRPEIAISGRNWSLREDVVDYAHIPLRTVLQPASLRLVPIDLRIGQGTVGYIPGSGDTVADDLAAAGMEVVAVSDELLRSGNLGRFKAIVVGIRAYNTRAVLRDTHARLMEYVERGGTVVVQYNTTSEWETLDTPIGPYELTLGRGRVTDEKAELIAVDPDAVVLTKPNRIGPRDFDGWVQERGLYFAETFDPRYEPVFRVHDPGESALPGSLLIAQHGKGHYVYTGLAFFRQLPAGVPGAYRLLANLIALGEQ
jgi:hypothetical protein